MLSLPVCGVTVPPPLLDTRASFPNPTDQHRYNYGSSAAKMKQTDNSKGSYCTLKDQPCLIGNMLVSFSTYYNFLVATVLAWIKLNLLPDAFRFQNRLFSQAYVSSPRNLLERLNYSCFHHYCDTTPQTTNDMGKWKSSSWESGTGAPWGKALEWK